ncbi:MAG: hypothetical protein QG670_496 [Thermoproteota archaeon]|nr:hypothetical protein [Thermoproteota archaeon]
MFREESIVARAKQVLDVDDKSQSNLKKNFHQRIIKYHPDKCGSEYAEEAKVLIEAYQVLRGRANPLNCRLLEDKKLVASLLSQGMKPVELGIKYEDWLKENFYGFVKPNTDNSANVKTNRRNSKIKNKTGL